MTPKEQETAIGELEERVDRLRNLYEQYFLGFEKLEPSVSRKDVDRRFMLLRKEQIRNTAMRFRFNVVTQKFNTYAMHWVRICRQIEDGTYKRHIRKAKARFGDVGRTAEREVSFDVDIDIDDFETDDVDALLAEADASVGRFENSASDTIPPAPVSRRNPPAMVVHTPGTSFAVGGGREGLGEGEPMTPPPMVAGQERAQRGAALPPGGKPRVMLRKRDEAEPPSARSMPLAPIVASAPPPVAPPPGSSPRLAARPALDIPGGRPAGPRIVRSPAVPESSQGPAAPAASAGRLPAASPSAGRLPAPAQAPGPSVGRIPAASPSAGRLPLPAPPPAPSAGRLPVASAPQGRPGMPIPPISSPRLPVAPASRPGPPPARPPMPSVSDEGSPPSVEPRSTRPRAPLPLPSQTRPKKE